MAQFDLSWVGEYIPMNVQANDFLNEKLESDLYGIYYSVQFEGNAETYLLQAKKAPVKGVPEWGMIELAKSGKSYRFKRVKREEGGSYSSSAKTSDNSKAFLKDASTIPLDVYKTRAHINGLPTNETERTLFFQNVMADSDELLKLIENVRGSQTVNPTIETKVESLPAPALGIKKKLASADRVENTFNGDNIDDEIHE